MENEQPKRVPEIREEMTLVDKQVECLKDRVNQLIAEIGPITRPEFENTKSDAVHEQEPLTELGKQIRQVRNQLQTFNHRLEIVIELIEL
jgi:ubiquinone biosynthesis protein UbiJ